MKQVSSHKSIIKHIRREIKAVFPEVPCKIELECFSKGVKVRIYLEDQPPAVEDTVRSIALRYLNLKDMSAVTLVSVINKISKALWEKIENYILSCHPHYSSDTDRLFMLSAEMFHNGSFVELQHTGKSV